MLLLLNRGADVEARDAQGRTALARAEAAGQKEAATLLKRCAEEKCTALMLAAEAGCSDITLLLLAGPAEVLAKDAQGRTALARAEHAGKKEVASLLGRCQAGQRTALMLAAEAGDAKIVRTFLDCGDPIDATDSKGRTALLRAAHAGQSGVVSLLLERGADPNAVDREGLTALMLAASSPCEGSAAGAICAEVMAPLLRRHADLDVKDAQGRTALMHAESVGKERATTVASLFSGYQDAVAAGMTSMKLAIIDDDRDLCEMVAAVAEKSWVGSVATATDLETGFELLSRMRPDVAFIDFLLGRDSGISLCQKVKATDWGRQIRLIGMSGHRDFYDAAIRNESAPNLFWWVLTKPFGPAQMRDLFGLAVKAKSCLKEAASAGRVRVLIVDDTPEIVRAVAARLESMGFDVATADGGKSGISKAEEYRPHIVLLDIMMPDVDGMRVYQQITSNDWGRKIWFIIISEAERETELVSCRERESLGLLCVPKPIDADQLALAVTLAANVLEGTP